MPYLRCSIARTSQKSSAAPRGLDEHTGRQIREVVPSCPGSNLPDHTRKTGRVNTPHGSKLRPLLILISGVLSCAFMTPARLDEIARQRDISTLCEELVAEVRRLQNEVREIEEQCERLVHGEYTESDLLCPTSLKYLNMFNQNINLNAELVEARELLGQAYAALTIESDEGEMKAANAIQAFLAKGAK